VATALSAPTWTKALKPQLQSAGETSETSMLAVSGGTQTDSCDCTNCVQNGGLDTASIVANPATHNITADECFQKCKDNTGQGSGQTCAFALYDDALPLMGCNHIYDNEHGNHSRQGEQVEDAKNRCHDANGKTTNGMMWTFPGGIYANGNAFAEYNWTFRTTQKCWFYPEVPKKMEAALDTSSIVSVIIDNDCVEGSRGASANGCHKESNFPFQTEIKPNSISIGKEGRCACGDPVASCGTPLTTCSQDSDCNNIQCSGHKWCAGIEGAIDDEARGNDYYEVGSGHCVDSSNRRPPHCYTHDGSISDENTCKSACTAVSGCSAYEWGQTGGYCQLIWKTGISSLNNTQHSATTGSCSSSVLNNWKYNLNGDSNYAGGPITSTYHNTGGKCYARGLRGEYVQWQSKCPAPESYPVKWDHVNGAAIPTSALTAGGARRGTFTIKSISNNKVTLSDDTAFTMPEKVDSQHPDAFGTGGASQYKCWTRS